MKIIVTGCAGFIGMHLCHKLLTKHEVIGIDNLNDYYNVNLKKKRLSILKKKKNFKFHKIDINDYRKLRLIFNQNKPKIVVHLAGEVGVRNSLKEPRKYINSNIIGFFNILENCKNIKVKKLFYASSSSVYGNTNEKFREQVNTDKPLSVYAATKKSAELLAYSYSHLYNLSTIGLRFFTVYGPYGRPDMAIFNFTSKIYKRKLINVYGKGNLERDFTYIEDVINHINNLIPKKFYGHNIFNIGNTKPIKVKKLISLLEQAIGIKAKTVLLKTPNTEVNKTSADISKLKKLSLARKRTSIDLGISNFVNWYKEYKRIK